MQEAQVETKIPLRLCANPPHRVIRAEAILVRAPFTQKPSRKADRHPAIIFFAELVNAANIRNGSVAFARALSMLGGSSLSIA